MAFNSCQFVTDDVAPSHVSRGVAVQVCGEQPIKSKIKTYDLLYDFAKAFHGRPTCVREIGPGLIFCFTMIKFYF